ncbi:MAG TPA: SURF1 family protein [Ilumatobacteraceae bacterium]|nr:SURF1 family protein [Ilumatobacteraceae bacterium]
MSGSHFSFLLRPKWIAFHVLVFGSVALMIWLAFWQLDRLDERRAFNDRVTEQIERPPTPLDQLLDGAGDDPETIEWRQALVSGRYLPDQVAWFNRSQDGLAGDNVLTALVTDDGTTVVVNRGFVPLGVDVPAPPTGDVQILARVRLPQERQRGELTDATDSDAPVTEVRRIDLGQLSAQLPGEVAPVYLDLIDSIPAVELGDPVPIPAPTLDEGPHLSYAAQWFIFAACVVIGWVLAVRRSIRTHRRDALTAGADGPALPGSDRPDDVEAASSTTGTGAPSRH